MGLENTQVLTFTLGEEDYCIDIEYVAEIVDGGEMTALPNTDDHVEGIMDLRGRTTTIVNPCTVLDTDAFEAEEMVTDGGRTQNRIIVLDDDTIGTNNTTGWLVSDVKDVTGISRDELEGNNVGETDILRGLIKKDDEFTLWLDPQELTA
jgi:purine-binding chemotaxis protein CheW